MADEQTPPTQTEILEKQAAEIAKLTSHVATLSAFLNNDAATMVTTESGQIPSLRGVIEQIRQQAGNRVETIVWSGEDLTRYGASAEVMLRSINLRPLQITPDLAGSSFRLETATGQPVVLELNWNGNKFTVTFPANSNVGAVTAADITEVTAVPAGSMLTVRMTSAAWTAAGMALAVGGMIDIPSEPVAG